MAISVAGSVFDTSGVKITTGLSVGLRINGGTENLETSDGSGDFTFASISPSAGDTITLYINGETQLANAITITDSTTNITLIVLRDDRITIRSDNGSTAITNADLGQWDNADDATDMLFDVADGTNDLTSEAPNEFEVVSGSDYAPGADTTIGSRSSSSTLLLVGTWTAADGETYRVFGDVDFTSGTYNRDTTDIFYFDDPTGGAGDTATLTLLGAAFSKIQVGSVPATSSSDAWSFDSMTVHVEARFDKGTLEGGTLTLKGNYIMDAGGGMGGGASLLIDGTGAQALTANDDGTTSNITINKSSGTLTATGSWTHNRNWTFTAGTVVMTGTTVEFTDNSVAATYIITSGTMEFNNVTIQTLSSSSDFQLADNIVVNGNFNLNKGTWDVNGKTFTLSGNYTDDGSSTGLDNTATSTFILNGIGTQTITPDALVTWSTLQITNSSATVTFVTFGFTTATFDVSAGASIVFEDVTTYTISTSLKLLGNKANLITLRSSLGGTQAIFTLTGGATQDVDFVDVQDIDSSLGDQIVNSPGGVEGTNVDNWDFGPITMAIISVS